MKIGILVLEIGNTAVDHHLLSLKTGVKAPIIRSIQKLQVSTFSGSFKNLRFFLKIIQEVT